MKEKWHEPCPNCGGSEEVSISIPCPKCVGNGIDELTALRDLANFVTQNCRERSKPNRKILELLRKIAISQGKALL